MEGGLLVAFMQNFSESIKNPLSLYICLQRLGLPFPTWVFRLFSDMLTQNSGNCSPKIFGIQYIYFRKAEIKHTVITAATDNEAKITKRNCKFSKNGFYIVILKHRFAHLPLVIFPKDPNGQG